MAATRMLVLMLVCSTACVTFAESARQRPIFRAVPTPVHRDMLVPSFAMQDEVVASVADPERGVGLPTRTVIVTQAALRSVTIIKTSVITIVETTIVNAMTSTTIYQTVPITIRPAPTTKTITLPCSLPGTGVIGPAKVVLPAFLAEKEPVFVETPIEYPTPVVAEIEDPMPVVAEIEDPMPVVAEIEVPMPVVAEIKDPMPVVAEIEDPMLVVAEAFLRDPTPAPEKPASDEQITKLQNDVDVLMDTFNNLLTQIEMTVERQALANRMRSAAKKLSMLRSLAAQAEFVRNLKIVVSRAAMMKANPKVFFNSVEELVDKMEKYGS